MKRVGIKVAVALAVLVLSALGLEHAVRRLDAWGVSYYADVQSYLLNAVELVPGGAAPDNHLFQNKPNVALLELRTFEYRTDARRLRTGRDRVPPEGGMPILFLGDSVTLGWGVNDEDTWVRGLERLGRAPDGRPLECLNFGHLMYDTVQEASLLRAFGSELAPELVILTFIYNDVHPTIDQLPGSGITATQAEPAGPVGSLLDRAFPTLRRLVRFRRDLEAVRGEDRSRFPPFSYYPSGWPRCAAALDDVRRTCAALGARLVVNDHVSPPMPEVAAWCATNDVLRLSTALDEEAQLRYRNSVIDSHLNAEGNAVVAELALEQLVAAGLLVRAE